MGSASRQALVASREALSALGAKVDVDAASALFSVGRAIAGSTQLSAALADASLDASTKANLLGKVFGKSLSGSAATLASGIVGERWSNEDEMLGGIEEIAIRAAAIAAGPSASIEAEIFSFSRAVATDAELELTLGSKLEPSVGKAALATQLLKGKAHKATIVIVSSLVAQPRGRRVGALLSYAAAVVANQAGASVATVTSARPLTADQRASVSKSLSTSYGRDVLVNAEVDESIIGGIRIQVGDDVMDGTVSSRLNQLRRELVG
jgi:F-type H+-transporting ATPase subunit delta